MKLKRFSQITAVLLYHLGFAYLNKKCPILTCDSRDEILVSNDACFFVTAEQDGTIARIRMTGCSRDSKQICFLQKDKYTWVNTDLQFMTNASTFADSQFYNKLTISECRSKSDVLSTRLYAGRKCLYAYQCLNRNCDEETNVCTGASVGSSCSSHMDCDSDLSCRIDSVWPYASSCQPRGEVGSLCSLDYDCKSRNFCWAISRNSDKICLEKHNAPFGTQFMWDEVTYPKVNKTSVMHHGQYCQSGFAMRRAQSVAECVNITNVTLSTDPSNSLAFPQKCQPDGKTQCQYRVGNEIAFNLTCECALKQNPDKTDIGYCPLADYQTMRSYIKAIKQVWYQDTCHTFDRENFYAQIDCGIGNNDDKLSTAIDLKFKVNYYPFLQENSDCIYDVFPDSPRNAFV